MVRNLRCLVSLKAFLVLACMLLLASCAGFKKQHQQAPVPEIAPGIWQGYLAPDAIPKSLALIPPPPSEGSTPFVLDKEISKDSFALRGSLRWDLAAEDAELMFPMAAGAFSCALNAPITEQDTPHLYMLLRRTITDAGFSTHSAKVGYKRTRPFVENKEPICTPNAEAFLKNNGSYPSGHTAAGWAWALILTEVAPDRADAILARGRAYGQSRVICNVHWQSDVIEGRFMGAAVVASLHADPLFRADLEAAKVEFAAVRAKGLPPQRDCAAEAKALSLFPPSAPWPADK